LAATTTRPILASEEAAREASKRLGEPAWLLDQRLASLRQHRELPLESNPLFTRHTEVPKDLDGLSLDFEARPILEGPQGAGARLEELGSALGRDAESLRPFLTATLETRPDKHLHLARALATTGAFLHVPRDAHVAEPFTIRCAPRAGAMVARNVLVFEAGAQATVIEDLTGGAAQRNLLAMSTEIHLGPGAELRLLGVDTSSHQQVTLLARHARLAEGAKLSTANAYLGSGLLHGRSDIALAERGAEVRHSEVVFGSEAQRFDLTTYITHQAPSTLSDALSKAVMRDQSRANIKGVIHIAEQAKDSDSFLAQHAMLMSRKARCIAVPSLEIINRDIRRAKHAATVAQVDDDHVFYLQTRGLSDGEARKAIVMGFLEPLLARLGDATAERVRQRVDAKWG